MSLTDIDMSEELTMNTHDREIALQLDIDALVEQMESVIISNDKEFTAAAEWLKLNKYSQKQVKEFYEEDRVKTYAAYNAVTKKIKSLNDLLSKGEKIVKTKLADYQKELDRKQREEEAKIRKQQEAAERKERERINAAREKLEKLNAERAKAGKEEEIMEEPEPQLEIFIAPAPIKESPDTAGVVFAEVWKWELEDKEIIPREFLILDEKKINGLVRAMKGDTKINGIRVYVDKQVRA